MYSTEIFWQNICSENYLEISQYNTFQLFDSSIISEGWVSETFYRNIKSIEKRFVQVQHHSMFLDKDHKGWGRGRLILNILNTGDRNGDRRRKYKRKIEGRIDR